MFTLSIIEFALRALNTVVSEAAGRRAPASDLRAILLPTMLALGSAVCAAATSDTGALDLTPLPGEYVVEGIKRPLVNFRSAGAEIHLISYVPPWRITGSFESATMQIPESAALGRIWKADNHARLDLSDEDAVRAWTLSNQPPGANDLKIETVEKNPVFIDGKPSVEITFTYGLYGRPLKGCMLVTRRALDCPEMVVFEISCHPGDFVKLHRLLQQSLYSIQGF